MHGHGGLPEWRCIVCILKRHEGNRGLEETHSVRDDLEGRDTREMRQEGADGRTSCGDSEAANASSCAASMLTSPHCSTSAWQVLQRRFQQHPCMLSPALPRSCIQSGYSMSSIDGKKGVRSITSGSVRRLLTPFLNPLLLVAQLGRPFVELMIVSPNSPLYKCAGSRASRSSSLQIDAQTLAELRLLCAPSSTDVEVSG